MSDDTIRTEILRSRLGDTITVKTKFNERFQQDVEHIEISARQIPLEINTETLPRTIPRKLDYLPNKTTADDIFDFQRLIK